MQGLTRRLEIPLKYSALTFTAGLTKNIIILLCYSIFLTTIVSIAKK